MIIDFSTLEARLPHRVIVYFSTLKVLEEFVNNSERILKKS